VLVKTLPILVGVRLLAGAAGRQARLDDLVGAGVASVAAVAAEFLALRIVKHYSMWLIRAFPTPDAGPDHSVYLCDPVPLSGTWTDPAGNFDNPYAWSWDLTGDGLPDNSGGASYGDTITDTASFTVEALYTLTFEVTDKDGGHGSDSLVVDVLRRPPQLAKEFAVDWLTALLPSGDKKTDHRIETAVKHLAKSLAADLWIDESHLTDRGKKAFDEERKAVKELMKIVEAGGPLAGDAQAIINDLVIADETLAQTAIDEAITAGGNAKEIAKAQKEMAKALDELAKGHYNHAIKKYKKAWEHAHKAIK